MAQREFRVQFEIFFCKNLEKSREITPQMGCWRTRDAANCVWCQASFSASSTSLTLYARCYNAKAYLRYFSLSEGASENNPSGPGPPEGPLGPEGAQGARRAPPLGPIGSLGPRRCAPANLKKTRNDIMALRVRFVATLLHSKGAAVVPQGGRE